MYNIKRPFFILFTISCFVYILVYSVPGEEVEVPGWELNVTRNISDYIFSNMSSVLPKHFCKEAAFLVFMVCTSPSNFEARSAIRGTWGSVKTVLGKDISVYFLLGETANTTVQNHITIESNHYLDIIQDRFLDSYNNLTLKSVDLLRLVSTHCTNTAKYVMKIDDDVYANVEQLIRVLENRNTTENLLLGKKICNAKPIKRLNNKWYSPRYMYRASRYPDYLSGISYLMSIDVASKLYEASFSIPIFHLEDIYVTGLCARHANIKIENENTILFQQVQLDMCKMRLLSTAHELEPHQLRQIYETKDYPDLETRCKNYRPNFYNSSCKEPRTVQSKRRN